MSDAPEYPYTTADLATEFRIKSTKTVRKRAKALGLGIDFGGRAGFRYSENDRLRLIESLKPQVAKQSAVKPSSKKRAA